MTTIMFTNLPDEVIAIILGYNDISIEDIINFRCVCKQFRWAVTNDKYWEKKFSQRWPSAKKFYDKQSKENEQKEFKENEQKNKKSLYFMETGINCVRQLRNYVSQIIHKYYHDNNSINNLTILDVMFSFDEHLKEKIRDLIDKPENFIKYCFFTDEMKSLLTSIQSPPRAGCDLTEIYCNKKLFCYMREHSVREKWYRYINQPSRDSIEYLLERTATIVARRYQPEKDVFYSWVKESIDSIALEVLTCLREKHPDHSIFSTSAETFSYWKNNNIHDNYWNEAEGTQIMDTLQEYIFGKLNFRPSKLEDLATNLEHICIDNVLRNRKGLDIILLIIYHSVAKRLGLRCDVIDLEYDTSFIPMYSIFWKPKYAGNSSENIRCFNISDKEFPDCLDNQLLLLRTLYSNPGIPSVITAVQMYNKMIEIVTNALVIRHFNNALVFKQKQRNEFYGCTNMLSLSVKKTEQLNTRPEDVKFAVGMIVTHVDQSTNSCAGVIIGWDRKIDRQVPFSIHSVWDMNKLPLNLCCNINFTKLQTNYIILTDNNKMCYVGEDAITLTTPKWIKNSEIGRYFCKFEDTHYVQNKMLARLYPQDFAITTKTTISEN